MDEIADDAAYAVAMKIAQDLGGGEERSAVPLGPTPPPALPPLPARAPPTTRVVNRLAPSANGAFVAIANRDADKDTVRLGAAALALAPRRGENVVRAQVAAVDARGGEEKLLVSVREEERLAHFAAAPGPSGAGRSTGRPHNKTLPPPALARLDVAEIGGRRRARLQLLPASNAAASNAAASNFAASNAAASNAAASNAASARYASGIAFQLRTSSKLGGEGTLLHKFGDQATTIVAGLLAHGVKPEKLHVAYELCSAWSVPLKDRVVFRNAVNVVKGYGPDAALVYCALSRATRSSEAELIELVDAAAPAHVLVAFPEEDALDIGDDPDMLTQYLASAIATSAGHSVYAQSWWHGTDALLYHHINDISRRVDIPRDLEALADVLNALVDQCAALGAPLPVVYLVARTSPGNKSKRARKRGEDERRAIAEGKPPPHPDEDKSVTLQLATLRLAVDAATRKRGSAVPVVEVVLQEDGGESRGELENLNAVALMRQAKRGKHPTPVAATSDASGGSVIAGTVAGLELELAATNAATNAATSGSAVARESNASGGSGSGSDAAAPAPAAAPTPAAAAPAGVIFMFTRADRVTRSIALMRDIAKLASAVADPARGAQLGCAHVMTVEVESTSSLLAGDSDPASVAARLCGGALTNIPPTLVRETRVGLELASLRGEDKTTLLPLPGVLSVENAGGYLSQTHVDFTSTFGDFAHVSGRDVETRAKFPSSGGGGVGNGAMRGASRGIDAEMASFIATRSARELGMIGAATGGGSSTAAAEATTGGGSSTAPPGVTFYPPRGVSRANDGHTLAVARDGRCAFDSLPRESAVEARTARPRARQACPCADCRVSVTRPEVTEAQRQEVRRATGEKTFAALAELAKKLAGGGGGGGVGVGGEGGGGGVGEGGGGGVGGEGGGGLGSAPSTPALTVPTLAAAPAPLPFGAIARLLDSSGSSHASAAAATAARLNAPALAASASASASAPELTAPALAASDLSESQMFILSAESEHVALVAREAFRDAWRESTPETGSVVALAAARAAIDAACAPAPELTAPAPELTAPAPELTAPAPASAPARASTVAPDRVDALDGPVIRCRCRAADASAKCEHAASVEATLRTVKEGRTTRVSKATYKLPDGCWSCHKTFPVTGDGGYGAFCDPRCFDEATEHFRADAIRKTKAEDDAVGALAIMERKKSKQEPLNTERMTQKEKKAALRKARANAVDEGAFTAAVEKAKVARQAGIVARRATKDEALREFGKEALDAAGVSFCDLPECGQMIPLGNIFGLACCNAHKKTQRK